MRMPAILAAAAAFAVAGCTSAPSSPAPSSVALLSESQLAVPADGPVVVSFLDPPEASSRSQIVVLRSMATQYTATGLTVVVADATGKATTDSLTNYSHDWNLGTAGVKVAAPAAAASLTAAYQVTAAPDTVLLSAEGVIVQRWQGQIATAQDLALAIQRLLPSASPAST